MIDITLYSAEIIEYELDVKHNKSEGNCSLFINHVDNSEYHDRNKFRLFLTLDQLRTLRDLLNEKLPPDVPKAMPPSTYTVRACPPI